MMLGSNEAFAAQSAVACGTYYLAKSYLDEGGWGDDFVVAPAGHELTLYDFRPDLRLGS